MRYWARVGVECRRSCAILVVAEPFGAAVVSLGDPRKRTFGAAAYMIAVPRRIESKVSCLLLPGPTRALFEEENPFNWRFPF